MSSFNVGDVVWVPMNWCFRLAIRVCLAKLKCAHETSRLSKLIILTFKRVTVSCRRGLSNSLF